MPRSQPPRPAPAEAFPLGDLVDLLGRRGSLVALWNLRTGSQPFRTLVQLTGLGEAQVSQRLRELREAGIVEIDEGGDYRLSSHGRRLQGPLEDLGHWADGWADLTPRQRVPRGAADRGRGEG
ncbi:MAG TPA: winged helix-turn-helix transcriptional regulator [Frankiaceae bacterium]